MQASVSNSAEIITIGTELLLGDIVDTNAATLARALRGLGLDVYRTTSVGDNAERIAAAVAEACLRATVVITTGGLGPTVDDATREGIGRALDRPIEFHEALWQQIQHRFAQYGRTPTENNRRQALLPLGAVAIENPVGTAPAFRIESKAGVIIALPGVPSEMQALLETEVLPFLQRRFPATGVIRSRVLRTAGAGESWIDDQIQDLEILRNPTVGLAAHPGRVDIRITAKADSEAEAQAMLAQVEAELRARLAAEIYGCDDELLAQAVARLLEQRRWRVCAVEAGSGGRLAAQLAVAPGPLLGVLTLPAFLPAGSLADAMQDVQARTAAEVCLGLSLRQGPDRQHAMLRLVTPAGSKDEERTYGGPPRSAPAWASCLLIDALRRSLA
jgi:nicotinamide-nucleotide amidase